MTLCRPVKVDERRPVKVDEHRPVKVDERRLNLDNTHQSSSNHVVTGGQRESEKEIRDLGGESHFLKFRYKGKN